VRKLCALLIFLGYITISGFCEKLFLKAGLNLTAGLGVMSLMEDMDDVLLAVPREEGGGWVYSSRSI